MVALCEEQIEMCDQSSIRCAIFNLRLISKIIKNVFGPRAKSAVFDG